MNPLHLLKPGLARWQQINPTVRDNLAVFGSLALVLILVLVWAAFFRKRPRHGSPHHRHHHQLRPASSENFISQNEDSSAVVQLKRHKRRRRRREHRPRNPTLAETGGLPPLRAENPPESFP